MFTVIRLRTADLYSGFLSGRFLDVCLRKPA
jgi:hypothetical protein